MRVKKLEMGCMIKNMLNSEQPTLTQRDTLRIRLSIKYHPSGLNIPFAMSPKHYSLYQGKVL